MIFLIFLYFKRPQCYYGVCRVLGSALIVMSHSTPKNDNGVDHWCLLLHDKLSFDTNDF